VETELTSEPVKHSGTPNSMPWWILFALLLVAIIAGGGFVLWNLRSHLSPSILRYQLNGTNLYVFESATVSDVRRLLQAHPQIETIAFEGGPNHTDRMIALLERHPTIKTVSVDNAAITDHALASLTTIPNLIRLTLSDTLISDDGLCYLQYASQLESLYLSRTKINGTGLVHLANLQKLTWLNLEGTQITDSVWREIPGFSNLKVLDLFGTQITDVSLERICDLKNLEVLYLNKNRGLNGSGLHHLEKLENLTSLSLDSNDIGDDEVRVLQKCKRLSYLSLRDTDITSKILFQLACYSNVEFYLPDCEEAFRVIREIHNENFIYYDVPGFDGRILNMEWHYQNDPATRKTICPKRMIPQLEE
jgi:Leucine-rich repeat (LRR) protein